MVSIGHRMVSIIHSGEKKLTVKTIESSSSFIGVFGTGEKESGTEKVIPQIVECMPTVICMPP